MCIFNSSPIPSWRQYSKRYGLEGLKCSFCGKVYFPTCFLCSCGSQKFDTFLLNGFGTLISYTNITNPCAEFRHRIGYCIGLIQFDDGPKFTVQLTDVDLKDLKIGMRVRAIFRKFYSHGESGIIEYGLKFVPYEFK